MNTLKIGIISETLVQQHYLKHSVEDSGYKPGLLVLVADLSEKTALIHSAGIDAWVVDVDMERLDNQEQSDYFDDWLANTEQPIIFSEGNTYNAAEADFISWARQLKRKLLHLEGQLALLSATEKKATNIWVLAASTGGPEVVKHFLDKVNKDLDLGFVYAQHIDHMQHQVLVDKICRDSHYIPSVAQHGDVVTANSLVVIPADRVIELQENGTLVEQRKKSWRGIYKPSIDQIVANVADTYGACSGVIFFTGMGDDGATACRLMALHGGQVWAQLPSSCTVASMPESAINCGCVSKIDSPENLAIHLNALLTPLLHFMPNKTLVKQ